MGWGSVIVAAIVAGSAGLAAAEGARTASPCAFEAAGAGKVATVTDGRSFLLEDGGSFRLAGIEVPPLPISGETGARAEAGLAARAALESMLLGQIVALRQAGAPRDRYNRALAHAAVIRDGVERSAAHEMLALGYARVGAQTGERACAAELLGRERAARDGKLGLWAEPGYWLMGAESATALLAERGQFTLVEGKVLSVRESGGTIYMNFGRRWSEALTVTIPKRQERTFTAAGIAPKQLENRRVRVRGWIEERNGPRIEAVRPEQIEIAERN
jgi:endonuclease YncB( thermonuclease family)